jgi:hypothetical protein
LKRVKGFFNYKYTPKSITEILINLNLPNLEVLALNFEDFDFLSAEMKNMILPLIKEGIFPKL